MAGARRGDRIRGLVAAAAAAALIGAGALATIAAPPAGGTGAGPSSTSPPTPVSATALSLSFEPESNTSLTFVIQNASNPGCDAGSPLTVTSVVAGPSNTPVTPISTANQGLDSVEFTLPTGTPSPISVTVACDINETPNSDTVDLGFATLNVQKVVEGPDPAGTTFTVHVSCLNVDSGSTHANGFGGGSSAQDGGPEVNPAGDLQYGAGGGTTPFYIFGPSTCTVTETNNGGAASTSIVGSPVDVTDPIPFSVTVTNVFPLVVEPAFTG